ncbi:MAG: hypothetical protein GXP54_06390 [Deltaproteobacteria bacterium]|nr:hypothetical protein [Deltaproteobacteria bacterium]
MRWIRRIAPAAGLVFALAASAGCRATVQGSECHGRINDCLERCPEGPRVPEQTPGSLQLLRSDSRSMCERNCHGLCR